jgi:hypothetical protein
MTLLAVMAITRKSIAHADKLLRELLEFTFVLGGRAAKVAPTHRLRHRNRGREEKTRGSPRVTETLSRAGKTKERTVWGPKPKVGPRAY